MTKVKVEHELLDSKIATATALFNEWIKWCNDNNIKPRVIASIPKLFEVTEEEYNETK
jgi:hypothetical protein